MKHPRTTIHAASLAFVCTALSACGAAPPSALSGDKQGSVVPAQPVDAKPSESAVVMDAGRAPLQAGSAADGGSTATGQISGQAGAMGGHGGAGAGGSAGAAGARAGAGGGAGVAGATPVPGDEEEEEEEHDDD